MRSRRRRKPRRRQATGGLRRRQRRGRACLEPLPTSPSRRSSACGRSRWPMCWRHRLRCTTRGGTRLRRLRRALPRRLLGRQRRCPRSPLPPRARSRRPRGPCRASRAHSKSTATRAAPRLRCRTRARRTSTTPRPPPTIRGGWRRWHIRRRVLPNRRRRRRPQRLLLRPEALEPRRRRGRRSVKEREAGQPMTCAAWSLTAGGACGRPLR